ncbi:MAG: hypothetical protein A3G60_00940 [Candidatus Ryanbacteria bacterium RIFCSPLOWO2_12_FULL_47_9c]|uniref:Uncharacterized protein n=1 Tax=Candidatus Ryanbacteria bacterium RIFCSPLOWO2_12_FULL_47_9c TaxID=1802131 RepID=A0A1G2H3V0_9BACT|nr:MAG: hypothetical protein A3G60_00940 [Candidatus Ryanbacteria bacterium RIFCSPLOWO2_12_FULL_47_9c]
MKKQFGWKINDIRKARREALLKARSVDLGPHADEPIGKTMERIQDLLTSCYEFDFSPLGHLRKYFPEFEWKFIDYFHEPELSPERTLSAAITSADYLWTVFNDTFVVATRKSITGKPHRICWERKEGLSPDSEWARLVKRAGGFFV